MTFIVAAMAATSMSVSGVSTMATFSMPATMASTMIAAMAMLLRTIFFIVTVAATMPIMATTVSAVSCLQLRRHLGLLLKLNVDEVPHVMRSHIGELIEFDSTLDCWQDLCKL